MRIVILDALTLGEVNWKKLEEFGDVEIFSTTNKTETIDRVKNADIVITNKVVIDKEIIDNSEKLKLIQVAATGVNNIDVEYAKEKGIIVRNVAGYSTDSVVQLTFALILGLMCKIKYFDQFAREKYPESSIFTHIQDWSLIKGKKWGIIGLGNIGKKVAKIAECFGAEVCYYSTSGQNNNDHFKRVELDELLKSAKIVSIHAPLNSSTNNLLDYGKLSLMQEDSILINVGRGGIVNEKDLAKILSEKNIYVGLDVYETEPFDKNNPILNFSDKTLFTPHIAWTSVEAREKLINGIFENIEMELKKWK